MSPLTALFFFTLCLGITSALLNSWDIEKDEMFPQVCPKKPRRVKRPFGYCQHPLVAHAGFNPSSLRPVPLMTYAYSNHINPTTQNQRFDNILYAPRSVSYKLHKQSFGDGFDLSALPENDLLRNVDIVLFQEALAKETRTIVLNRPSRVFFIIWAPSTQYNAKLLENWGRVEFPKIGDLGWSTPVPVQLTTDEIVLQGNGWRKDNCSFETSDNRCGKENAAESDETPAGNRLYHGCKYRRPKKGVVAELLPEQNEKGITEVTIPVLSEFKRPVKKVARGAFLIAPIDSELDSDDENEDIKIPHNQGEDIELRTAVGFKAPLDPTTDILLRNAVQNIDTWDMPRENKNVTAPENTNSCDMIRDEYSSKHGYTATDYDVPKPNTKCPRWLHEMYITKPDPVHTESTMNPDEPLYWKTWHPSIDPIYWCYFDHEHGDYPGDMLPTFGYTAFKNDNEPESNEGFKVSAFSLPDDPDSINKPVPEDRSAENICDKDNQIFQNKGRMVVMTVHAQLARARRFSTRDHTGILSVYRKGEAEGSSDDVLEMSTNMKLDFGDPKAKLSQKPVKLTIGSNTSNTTKNVVGNPTIDGKSVRAERKFLVGKKPAEKPCEGENLKNINYSGHDPDKGDGYETWLGLPVNTCIRREKFGDYGATRGIEFQFRKPSTMLTLGALQCTTDDNISRTRAVSLPRVSQITARFLIHFCQCGVLSKDITKRDRMTSEDVKDGHFYTNKFFTELSIRSNTGLRQYMSDSMISKGISFPGGKIFGDGTLNGQSIYQLGGGETNIQLLNPENSVRGYLN